MSISKTDKKKLCSGCRSERYNMGVGYQETNRDTPVSCEECWSLSGSRIVNKLIYYSPNDYEPHLRTRTLSCWHNNMGYGEVIK